MAAPKKQTTSLTVRNGREHLPVVPFREFKEMVINAMTMRQEFIRSLIDPRRDIDKECGYPDTFSAAEYRRLYERDPISARVVQIMPNAIWQQPPRIRESESAKVETPFEKAFAAVGRGLRGRSWFESDDVNPIWEYCRRVDELCGIGQFGVLLVGFDDGKPLDQPVAGVNEFGQVVTNKAKSPTQRKLLFLQAFDESCASITKWEENVKNPRFGMPVEYLLTFNSLQGNNNGQSSSTAKVHWSRVIHVAPNVTSSEVFGTPRMRPVLNRLLDLIKLFGGSAEMYWKAAFMGLSIESAPGMDGMSIDIDEADLKRKITDYQNGLQRYLALIGMQAKSLAPQVSDPTAQIDAHIQAICIQLNVPKRKFTGSERGELASTQDDGDWNDQLRGVQNGHATPRIVVPLTNRLIMANVIPEPQSYGVEWPAFETLSEVERAQVAFQKTQALSTYVSGSVEAMMDPTDFLTRILGYTDDEAKAITEASSGALEGAGGITGALHEITKPPPPVIAPGAAGAGAKGFGAAKAKPAAKGKPTSKGKGKK